STTNKGLFGASQAYDAIKGRYDLGAANFVELSTAQAVLLQAKVNRTQAIIKLSLQKNVIDYYLGR
ncbi:MAG: outer rane efflux protein, partial [Bacteroidetes bacterium]|nr:outer rane efflux protein [Bacteroidota bacterium]